MAEPVNFDQQTLKRRILKHPIVISSGLIVLATALSVFFLAPGDAGQVTSVNAQTPLFAAAPGSPIAVASGPSDLVIGDMNKDGKPDLIVASGTSRALTVLLGKGDGEFRAGPKQTVLADSPGEMALGDVNGDGSLDLAVVSHDSYGVTLLLGDGKGGLTLAPNSPIVMKDGQHPHTHGLAIGDLNGDSKLDLAIVNNADNDISIAFGDGRGGFTRAPAPSAVGPSPYPMTLGDVNNDKHLDIVATASATGPARAQQLANSRALTLLLSDGRGGFRSSQLPLRTGQPWFVVVGDANNDGKADLLATHHDQNKLTVVIGDGQGGFAETSSSPLDFGGGVFQMVLADVNRDRKPDVLAASGSGVRVMLGDGRGGFNAAPHSPFVTGRGTWRVATADFNGDGKADVATTNFESNAVGVLLGQ
jgi:hypothetical protein